MKPLITMLAISLVLGSVHTLGEEGLFIPDREVEPKQGFEDGEIVIRWQAERLTLTSAIFRADTGDEKKFWLELDFTKHADPGDFYLFKIDGKDYTGFTVRGQGTNEGGGRWALGFTDADLGRGLLKKIAQIYELQEAQVSDQTRGEQGAGLKRVPL